MHTESASKNMENSEQVPKDIDSGVESITIQTVNGPIVLKAEPGKSAFEVLAEWRAEQNENAG